MPTASGEERIDDGFPLANVLSRPPIAASPEAVVATLRECFEDVAVELPSPSLEGKRGFILRMDGIDVVPVFEDFRLGLDELKPLHGRLQDADGPLLDDAAHVMVMSPHRCEGHELTLRASMAELQIASAISEQPGAHAVLWSFAESLTPVRKSRAEIAGASEHDSAFEALTRIGQFQAGTEDGKPVLGIWAMALAPSLGRDIEFVPKPLPACHTKRQKC